MDKITHFEARDTYVEIIFTDSAGMISQIRLETSELKRLNSLIDAALEFNLA